MRVFLDTNILIDLLDTARPEHEASTRLLRAIQAGKIAACISPISIVNTIYVLRKAMPPMTLSKYLLRMVDTMELAGLEREGLRNALMSGWNDLEDSIQHQSALGCGPLDAIISHDADMKRHSSIPVLGASEALRKLR